MDDEPFEESVDRATVAMELESAHERASDAYARQEAEGYMAMFHTTLVYIQPDGRSMGYDDLARDVRAELARAESAWSELRRTALEVHDARTATETLEQRTAFAGRERMFGFLRRGWVVNRRGRYEWVRSSATWKVRRVDVFWEEVAGRWSEMAGECTDPLTRASGRGLRPQDAPSFQRVDAL